MILQALTEYFHRKDDLPKQGWIRRSADYSIVLDESGECIAIATLGTVNNGKTSPQEMLLPAIGKQALKHTNSGNDANFLWDNASFIFGRGNKGDQKLSAFLMTLQRWSQGLDDAGITAVRRFCTTIQQEPGVASQLFRKFQVEDDFEKRDPVIVFRLVSDIEGVHARETVRATYENLLIAASGDAVRRGNCLVTGAIDTPIASNETVIKGVRNAQPSGANIISFNKRSFESYGKAGRKGENAPVSLGASFAYTTALNHLLRKDSLQRIQVGDASTVFWAEKQDAFESIFGEIFKDDPDVNAPAVQALLNAVHSGQWGDSDENMRFHVLGLAPNDARISIRFYHCVTLRELGQRIAQHFEDLSLARGPHDPQYPSLFRLLAAVAVQNKADNIPPNLGGAIVDAIFAGVNVPYPSLWLNAAVGRCRAEQNVNYLRAAAIKACLNRQIRHTRLSSPHLFPEQEFSPMLDHANKKPAYRMGRLFAVLERIQEESAGGPGKLNATIRDRFYGAASSSPATVFPMLLKLKNHHVSKLDEKGRRILYRAFGDNRPDDYIGQITSHVAEIPLHLKLSDQGLFALGYYHQRQDFFTKKTDAINNTPTEGTQE
ncbi:MAG: type I-C CRISPR-associated protein Cas8c/Csd1 [Rhodoferax sp.]|nr:type I-C CRISPR-associated protein Cas8c/Csd1 [Rhodoferax sp.]